MNQTTAIPILERMLDVAQKATTHMWVSYGLNPDDAAALAVAIEELRYRVRRQTDEANAEVEALDRRVGGI